MHILMEDKPNSIQNNDLKNISLDEIILPANVTPSMMVNTKPLPTDPTRPAPNVDLHYQDEAHTVITQPSQKDDFIQSNAYDVDEYYALTMKYNPGDSNTTLLTLSSDTRKVKGKDISRLFTTESISNMSEETIEIKSILVNRGDHTKRLSSKGTIRWQESVKRKLDEQAKISSNITAKLIMTRGSQMKHIHTIIDTLRLGEDVEFVREDQPDELLKCDESGVSSLINDLGTGFCKAQQYIELTNEQENNLKDIKQQIKKKNDKYLRNHPELGVLLSLIYKQLFKLLPNDPVRFVAEYVHYLNTHRDELVVEPKVYVPFDKVQTAEEAIALTPIQEKEQVTVFARKLVEQCIKIASKGIAYVNVRSVVESMLRIVSPSEDEINSMENATNAVSDILMTLITSVAESRTRDTELFIAQILEGVLEHICPSVSADSEIYFEMLENVKLFVKSLVNSLFDKATN